MFRFNSLICSGCLAAAAMASSAAAQPWSDNFDSYKTKSPIQDQGGWVSLPSDFIGAFAVDDIAFSPPNSMQTLVTTSIAQPLAAASGRWTFTVRQFVASFILFGPTKLLLHNEFSLFAQTPAVRFNVSQDGFVTDELRPGRPLSVAFDEWAELRAEIDLDRDHVDTYYNGMLLSSGKWSISGGPAALAAVHVVSNAQLVFYDDFSVQPATVPGDLNGDGVVNTLDLGILLSSWTIPPATACAPPCPADLNGDGVVNSLDLGILLSSWTL